LIFKKVGQRTARNEEFLTTDGHEWTRMNINPRAEIREPRPKTPDPNLTAKQANHAKSFAAKMRKMHED
jgi:hypothetical protein